jgi:prevent-host-death family protein
MKKVTSSVDESLGEAISTAQARRRFSELINRVANEKDRMVLTRRGRPLAAIVPLEDLLWLEDLEDKEDQRAYRAAMREVKRKGTVSWERIKKELGLV